jgi:hypothetical protein
MARPRDLSLHVLLLLVEVAALLCVFRLGLWLVSFRALRCVVGFLAKPSAGRMTAFSAEQLSWAVSGVSRYVPRASCLTQALVLHVMLTRGGQRSQIYIGVAKEKNGRFESHAWVECGDRVMIGDIYLERFTPMMVWKYTSTH